MAATLDRTGAVTTVASMDPVEFIDHVGDDHVATSSEVRVGGGGRRGVAAAVLVVVVGLGGAALLAEDSPTVEPATSPTSVDPSIPPATAAPGTTAPPTPLGAAGLVVFEPVDADWTAIPLPVEPRGAWFVGDQPVALDVDGAIRHPDLVDPVGALPDPGGAVEERLDLLVNTGTSVWISTDAGRTWSDPLALPPPEGRYARRETEASAWTRSEDGGGWLFAVTDELTFDAVAFLADLGETLQPGGQAWVEDGRIAVLEPTGGRRVDVDPAALDPGSLAAFDAESAGIEPGVVVVELTDGGELVRSVEVPDGRRPVDLRWVDGRLVGRFDEGAVGVLLDGSWAISDDGIADDGIHPVARFTDAELGSADDGGLVVRSGDDPWMPVPDPLGDDVLHALHADGDSVVAVSLVRGFSVAIGDASTETYQLAHDPRTGTWALARGDDVHLRRGWPEFLRRTDVGWEAVLDDAVVLRFSDADWRDAVADSGWSVQRAEATARVTFDGLRWFEIDLLGIDEELGAAYEVRVHDRGALVVRTPLLLDLDALAEGAAPDAELWWTPLPG